MILHLTLRKKEPGHELYACLTRGEPDNATTSQTVYESDLPEEELADNLAYICQQVIGNLVRENAKFHKEKAAELTK